MTRRYKIWLALAVLFLGINVGGAWMAIMAREAHHAGVHVVLAFAAAVLVGQLVARRIENY
jgi:hypothetical protein